MASENKKSPDFSILICSRDRRKTLEDLCLNLLKIVTRFSFEIIVVEETDNPAPIHGVLYLPHPVASRGIPYARNLALAHANGEIIIFLDDDCKTHDLWLDELLAPFQDDSVVGVQGGVTVPETSNAIGWAESILGFPGGGISRVLKAMGENRTTKEISTLNCAYRKAVLEKVGGFDENLILGSEDFVFAKQACLHGRCLFVPDALVFHEPRGSLIKIWSWFVRRGRAEMRLVKLRRTEEADLASILKRSIACKFLLVVLAGASFPGFFIPLLILAFAAYVILQLVRYSRLWKLSKAPVTTIFLLPLVKLVMDSAMDWGRVRGLLFD